jgi:hypothetical protein
LEKRDQTREPNDAVDAWTGWAHETATQDIVYYLFNP